MAKKKNPRLASTVTPFSKMLAMILFILFLLFGFYLSMHYQFLKTSDNNFYKPSLHVTPTTQPTNIIYINEDDNYKTVTVKIGQEIQFNYDKSLVWQYGGETVSSGDQDPFFEDQSYQGRYGAQAVGTVVFSSYGFPDSIKCAPNAMCVQPIFDAKKHITVTVVITK